MLDTPKIVETAEVAAAVIHLTIARDEMPSVFGPAVSELMTTLGNQGIEPVGGIFAHHLKLSGDSFDFELGIQVSSPIEPAGRVKPGRLPAMKVARTVYTGPYEGLPGAWHEFEDWMNSNGHQRAGELWELYAIGPQSTPDPAQWRTELNRPLTN